MTRPNYRAQSRSEIDALLSRFGLAPRHSLGQHFLADPNVVERIVRVSGVGAGDRVVEVGVGTGTLTRLLAETGASVVAYEIDRGLEPLLAEVLTGLDVEVRFGNALDVDFDADLAGTGWQLVANLPYNVGTPLVLDLLRSNTNISRLTVMLQREVVRRLVAKPNTSDYGLPSVIAALHARPVTSFTVPPQVFIPPPAVDSEVIVLERVTASADAPRAIELAQAAFGQRRKMLRKSLSTLLPNASAALELAGIDETRRAETLSADEYLRLAAVT